MGEVAKGPGWEREVGMTDGVASGDGWTLYRGRWQEVLQHVAECDAVITDPPYSERTHSGQRHGRRDPDREACRGGWVSNAGIGYEHLTSEQVGEFAEHWGERCSGWIAVQTDHDLFPAWERALRACNRYVFHPVPIILKGMNVRLAGDGPSSWGVHMAAARPRSTDDGRFPHWGTLPGAYVGNPFDGGENTASRRDGGRVVGGKPLWLMRAIIRDYTRPGDLVVDPCAGGGTTLLAAVIEGRRAIGAEMDPDTFDLARKRLERGYTPTFDFGGAA